MEKPEPVDSQIEKLEAQVKAAIQSENPDSGIPAARTLLELNAASSRAWFLLGIIEQDRHNIPEDSATCLLRSTELDPEFADGWVELGYSYFQEQDYVGAIRTCEIALRLEPRNTRALLGRALSYQRLGNKRKAIGLLIRAKPYATDWPLPAMRLARMYYDCGHEDAALAECKTILEIQPESIEALSLAGLIEQFDFNGDCGLNRFERLAILEPENPIHWQGLGLAQALLGKFEHSRTSLFMAHRLDPEDVQTRLRLGLTLFFLEDEREEGQDWIDEALVDCRWRNDVDLGALFLVPLFVLRNINAPGLLELTRKLRMASHHLPEKYHAPAAGEDIEDLEQESRSAFGNPDAVGGASFEQQSVPDTADYWFEAAGDSLLFERKDEAILQLFRALEIHPNHKRAAAKLREINRSGLANSPNTTLENTGK